MVTRTRLNVTLYVRCLSCLAVLLSRFPSLPPKSSSICTHSSFSHFLTSTFIPFLIFYLYLLSFYSHLLLLPSPIRLPQSTTTTTNYIYYCSPYFPPFQFPDPIESIGGLKSTNISFLTESMDREIKRDGRTQLDVP